MVFCIENHGFCKQWQFYLFLFQFEYLFYFFLLIAVAFQPLSWIAMVSGHPCLVPEFSGEVLSFTQLSIILAVVYHKWLLLCWDIPSIPILVRVYFLLIINVVCFSKIISTNVMRVFCVTKFISTTVVPPTESG